MFNKLPYFTERKVYFCIYKFPYSYWPQSFKVYVILYPYITFQNVDLKKIASYMTIYLFIYDMIYLLTAIG
jgi:hypothetical protein